MRLVGFWHIGSSAHGGPPRDIIVQKQLREILKTSMFNSPSLDVTVNWMSSTTLSKDSLFLLAADPRFSNFDPLLEMKEEEEYYEFPTLNQLYRFCFADESEEAYVFYFHSKTKGELRWDVFSNYVANADTSIHEVSAAISDIVFKPQYASSHATCSICRRS